MAVTRRPPPARRPPPGRSASGRSAAARPAAPRPPAGAARPPVADPEAGRPAGRVPRPTQVLSPGPAPRMLRERVSPTSAQRFARRVRVRRIRRVLLAVLAVLLLAGAGWGALESSWATVQRIEVTGTERVEARAVEAEAAGEVGHPLLLARTADVARRVEGIRLIRAATVRRSWPGTLRIQVTERVPVAALPAPGGGLALVDRDGVVVERARALPAGLPELQVQVGARGVPALRGCLEVLAGLPASLTQRLLAIGADTPDGIWLRLRDSTVTGGVRVDWGDATQTPRKARVLTALLTQHAAGYDVRSPGTPAVRGS